MTGETLPAVQLRQEFHAAIANGLIGGASVLRKLSALAGACISNKRAAQDSVAFTLCTIFGLHADDRDDRAVTSDDTYLLMASGQEHLTEAVTFIEKGGSSDDAVRIIATLTQLTPKELYGH